MNAIVNCLKETTGYSACYRDISSCFLIDIMKTISPRHIRYHMQTDLEEKNDTWELENGPLGHFGPESKMNLKASVSQRELGSQEFSICTMHGNL